MAMNVVIVGMARSGTSAIAGIFARRGYYSGASSETHIREGDAHNPFGYFEADDLIERNVEVLRRAGYAHHNTWLFDPIPPPAVERIRELEPTVEHRRFVQSYDRRAPWLWKDPRLCFTLPYWWQLVDRAETRVLLVQREALDVYRSFRRMGWCPRGEEPRRALIERVEQHRAAAVAATEDLEIPHLTVDYADFTRAPRELAGRISSFVDTEVSVDDLNVRADLDHSTTRGRIATAVRLGAKRLPDDLRRRVEERVPERVLAALFRERRYARRRPPADLGNGGRPR